MRSRKKHGRRGAAAVEFAVVAPVFLIMVMGIIEIGRMVMVQQLLTNATREGAREAVLPEATETSVKQLVANYLAASSVSVSVDDVTVSPDPAGAVNNENITVKVAVNFSNVSWLPSSDFLGTIVGQSTMRAERLE